MPDDTSITPRMRSYGRNLHLLTTSNEQSFAGLYQDPKNPFLTFRDLVDELRLCFRDRFCFRPDETWHGIAFALNKSHRSHGFPLFITEGNLDTVIPSLPQPDPQRRAVVEYHIVHHTRCQLAENSPLEDHLDASCATHIPLPTRRRDHRYRAPVATSSYNETIQVPVPRTQCRKRKRSSLTSLNKKPENSNETTLQWQGLIDQKEAEEVIDSFAAAIMVSANRCAVTGLGQSWCFNPTIGPAVQAYHIVPPQHFHVYPTGGDTQDTEHCERHLLQAWHNTWDPQNGLILRKDIHELFDARLLSIHPDTHGIRAFVPYDIILEYHGRIATIPPGVDSKALAHHYEMSCIENMAAMMPIRASTTLPSTAGAETSAPPNSPS